MTAFVYADMHFIYIFCDGNATAASRQYQFRYPDQRQSDRHVFAAVHVCLRERRAVMA
jgi:hypothetical protein